MFKKSEKNKNNEPQNLSRDVVFKSHKGIRFVDGLIDANWCWHIKATR